MANVNRPFEGMEGLGRACVMIAALASALGQVSYSPEIAEAGLIAMAGFVIVDFKRARTSGRLFVTLAMVAALVVALAIPDTRPVILKASLQGLSFTALLVALATLRPAMQRSALLAAAAAWLITRRKGQRYISVSFGGHLLAIIFNIGVLQLIGDILAAAKLDFNKHPTARHLLLGTIRGSSAIALWSPLAMGFAVVTMAFPSLHPLSYIGYGLGLAFLLLTMGALLPRDDHGSDVELRSPDSPRALATLLLGAFALLAATSVLYLFVNLPFLTATTVLSPLFALIWIRTEPDAGGQRPSPIILARGLSDLRNEMFIFASSTVIGAIVAYLFTFYGPSTIVEIDSPLMPVAVVLLIWAFAAVSMPPSIAVILLSQLLATTNLAGQHALSLSLALSAGWSLAMLVSPISATLLLSARIANTSGQTIAWRWNRLYTLLALPMVTVALALVYMIE